MVRTGFTLRYGLFKFKEFSGILRMATLVEAPKLGHAAVHSTLPTAHLQLRMGLGPRTDMEIAERNFGVKQSAVVCCRFCLATLWFRTACCRRVLPNGPCGTIRLPHLCSSALNRIRPRSLRSRWKRHTAPTISLYLSGWR